MIGYIWRSRIPFVDISKLLKKYSKRSEEKILLITDCQLYDDMQVPPRKVVGIAFPTYGFAAVSTYGPEYKEISYNCLAQTIVHEIGHLYGLNDHYIMVSLKDVIENRIVNSNCVMDKLRISTTLFDELRLPFLTSIIEKYDERFRKIKKPYYCNECLSNFKKN